MKDLAGVDRGATASKNPKEGRKYSGHIGGAAGGKCRVIWPDLKDWGDVEIEKGTYRMLHGRSEGPVRPDQNR